MAAWASFTCIEPPKSSYGGPIASDVREFSHGWATAEKTATRGCHPPVRPLDSARVKTRSTSSAASSLGASRKGADEPDFIVVRGAREHNLNIDHLRIPKRQLVVFTGVS